MEEDARGCWQWALTDVPDSRHSVIDLEVRRWARSLVVSMVHYSLRSKPVRQMHWYHPLLALALARE